MAKIAISNASLIINNVPVLYTPGSLKYDEGLGEQTFRTQTAGGGQVETVYSDNAETKFSSIDFQLRNVPSNMSLAKGWKENSNANTIVIIDTLSGFSRTFQYAALVNNYMVELNPEGNIELNFKSNPAIGA
jgi:hypothetical protein